MNSQAKRYTWRGLEVLGKDYKKEYIYKTGHFDAQQKLTWLCELTVLQ